MRASVLAALLFVPAFAAAQTIPATEASHHVGEHATVCGTITGEHAAYSSRGTPTFINLDRPYPHQVFTALVWGEDRGNVGSIPASGQLCVTGNITEYHGVPEIVVRDAKSWYVPK